MNILASIVYYFIKLLNLTYRYEYVGNENLAKGKKINPKGSFVFAVWHQHLVGGIMGHTGMKVAVVVSASKDGELAATTCRKLGYTAVRGSSRRGGKEALIEMINIVQSGLPAALTVDGPKGPARVVKPGALEIARVTNSPIIPMCAYPTKFWQFSKSWDQFKLPKPFSRIIIAYGEPMTIPPELPREAFEETLKIIADKINQVEKVAIDYLDS